MNIYIYIYIYMYLSIYFLFIYLFKMYIMHYNAAFTYIHGCFCACARVGYTSQFLSVRHHSVAFVHIRGLFPILTAPLFLALKTLQNCSQILVEVASRRIMHICLPIESTAQRLNDGPLHRYYQCSQVEYV